MLNRCDYKPAGKDPRGPKFDEGEDLPLDHCQLCKCPQNMCHDTRFGLYCGFRDGELINPFPPAAARKIYSHNNKKESKVECTNPSP